MGDGSVKTGGWYNMEAKKRPSHMIRGAEIGPVSFQRTFDSLLLTLGGVYPCLYGVYFRL